MNFIVKLVIFGAISTILLKWNSTAFYDYYLFRSNKAHNESEISHEPTASDEDSNSENSEIESPYKRLDASFTDGEDVYLHKTNISELLNQIIEDSHRNEQRNGDLLVGNSASILSPYNRRKRSGKKYTLGYSLSRTIQEADENVYIDINKTSISEKTGIKNPDSVSNNVGSKDDTGSTSVDSPSKVSNSGNPPATSPIGPPSTNNANDDVFVDLAHKNGANGSPGSTSAVSPSKGSNSGNTNSPGSQSAKGQNKNPSSGNGGVNRPSENPPAPSLSTNTNVDGNKQTFIIDLEDPPTSNTNKGTNLPNPTKNNQTPNVPQKPPPYIIDLEDGKSNEENVNPSSSNTGGNTKPVSNSNNGGESPAKIDSPVPQSTNGQNKKPSSNSGNPPATSPIGPSKTNNANDEVYVDLPHKNDVNGSPGSTSGDSPSKGSNSGNTNSPGSQSANGQNKKPSNNNGNPPATSPIGPSNTNNANDEVYIDLAQKTVVNGSPGNYTGNNARSMKILESKNKENNASSTYSNSNIVTTVSVSTSFTNIEHKVNSNVDPNIYIDFPRHANMVDSFETTPNYADNELEHSAPIHSISATTTIPNIINTSPKESIPKENAINLAIGQTQTTSTSISAGMDSYERKSNAVYSDLHVITSTKTPKEQPFESTTKKALENSKLGDSSLSFNSSTETVAIISSTVESNPAGILISSQISTSTPTTDVHHGESARKFTNSLTTNEVRTTTSAEYSSETPRVLTSIQGDAKTTRPVSATPDFIIEYFTFSYDPLERSNGHPASTFLDDYDVYKQRGSIYYHCC